MEWKKGKILRMWKDVRMAIKTNKRVEMFVIKKTNQNKEVGQVMIKLTSSM